MTNDLIKTQLRLDRWRTAHRKKTRLPVSLKTEAVALLGAYSAREITKVLGISQTLFRKWQQVAAARPASRSTAYAKPQRSGKRKSLSAFIDVTPIVAAPHGTSLTIELAGRGKVLLTGELTETAVRAAVTSALMPLTSRAGGEA